MDLLEYLCFLFSVVCVHIIFPFSEWITHLLLTVLSSLYILDVNPFSYALLAEIFLSFYQLSVSSVDRFFILQMHFNLLSPHVSWFYFLSY